jgi:hypothetical protein
VKNLLAILIVLIVALNGFGQEKINLISLQKVDKNGKLKKTNMAVIYGNFSRRKIKLSNYFNQWIVVRNKSTNMYFKLLVMPDTKGAQENMFSFYIPKGEYEIITYIYGTNKSAVHGNTYNQNYEPVFNRNLTPNNPMSKDEIVKYNFKIDDNSIYYVGNWDFSTEEVKFIDDKNNFDIEFLIKYKSLKNKKTLSVIPK